MAHGLPVLNFRSYPQILTMYLIEMRIWKTEVSSSNLHSEKSQHFSESNETWQLRLYTMSIQERISPHKPLLFPISKSTGFRSAQWEPPPPLSHHDWVHPQTPLPWHPPNSSRQSPAQPPRPPMLTHRPWRGHP